MSAASTRTRSQNPNPVDTEHVTTPIPNLEADLAQENDELREEIARLRAAVRGSDQPRMTPAESDTSRDESFRPKRPNDFKGDDPSALASFLVQLSMYFDSRPRQFIHDQPKILFAALLFQDAAARWWTAEYRKKPADRALWTIDYQAFLNELERVFGRVDSHADAQRKLSTLRQDKGASEYYTRFLQYASESEFNEAAQMYHFRQGLKTDIKTALAANLNQYTTLSGLANAAILIDNHLYEDRKERRAGQNTNTNQPGNRNPTPQGRFRQKHQSNEAPKQTSGNNPPRQPGKGFVKPSGTIRAPLSDAEKQRCRDNNLCLYCGDKGHDSYSCPRKVRVAAFEVKTKSDPESGKD